MLPYLVQSKSMPEHSERPATDAELKLWRTFVKQMNGLQFIGKTLRTYIADFIALPERL